jgi:hypothetical protein
LAYKDKNLQREADRRYYRRNRRERIRKARLWRLAHPLPSKRITISDRFFRHVHINTLTGCWEWTSKKNEGGYGRFKVKGKHVRAHVVCWEMFRGNWPANGEQSDHECCNPSCVNPYHQEPVTQAENNRRAVERRKLKKLSM